MRHVICAFSTLLCTVSSLTAADLTVFLDFEAPHSARSVAEMKAETEKLLAASGVSVGWRTSSSFHAGESFPKIAVVKFQGQCGLTPFQPATPESDKRLGFTYRVNSALIPFGEVECDQIRATLRGAHVSAGEVLFGRAMGRVLAHELFHIMSGSSAHAKRGVMQRYLSAAMLLWDRI